MSGNFNGFGPEFFGFFDDLKANNDRDWFQANKERYRQQVVTPISAFITDMAPRLREISPQFRADPRPNGGSMFRIYRDVRFSKNKSPYKEHAGIQFRHQLGRDAHAPGFYVHLEKDNLVFGGGIWRPPSDALFKIRDRIAHKPEKWEAVLEDEDLQKYFGGVGGDSLKRPPKGFPADIPHLEDIKRKSFFAMRHKEDHSVASGSEFIDEVAKTFEAATPLMQFVSDALEVPF